MFYRNIMIYFGPFQTFQIQKERMYQHTNWKYNDQTVSQSILTIALQYSLRYAYNQGKTQIRLQHWERSKSSTIHI